jgi:hypothetical protein
MSRPAPPQPQYVTSRIGGPTAASPSVRIPSPPQYVTSRIGGAPATAEEDEEASLLERAIQTLDYMAGKTRGVVRGAFGGDPSDTASFGREFSDPESELGFLAPGGGLVPEISEDQSRIMAAIKSAPAFTAGLGADILTDPLTYLSFGTAGAAKTAATRAANIAARAARKDTGNFLRSLSTGKAATTAADIRRINRLKRISEQGGGLKFMGEPVPGTHAIGQAVEKVAAPIVKASIPLRRRFAKSRIGGPLREMFTTAPIAGSSRALVEIVESAKGMRFLTDLEEAKIYSSANEIASLRQAIDKRYQDVEGDDISRILADIWEKKPKGEYRFPEALEGGLPSAEFERLRKARDLIAADADAQSLVARARELTKITVDLENKAGVQTGIFGSRRQKLIDEYTEKIQREGLEGEALQTVEAQIAEQKRLATVDPEYMMHKFTDDAMQRFVDLNPNLFPAGAKGARQFSSEHASQISRELIDEKSKYLTAAEFNAKGRIEGIASLGGDPLDFDIFETNPFRVTIERQLRGIPKIQNARFLDEVAAKYGKTRDDIINSGEYINRSDKYGWIKVRNKKTNEIETLWKTSTVPGKRGKAVYFEKEVRDHLDTTNRISTDPEAITRFGQLFDSFQGYWKSKTLAMFPAYHSRNIVGNLWNNFIGGVQNPVWYDRARRIQKGEAGEIGGISFDQIRELAKELGVENQGWYSADIERKLAGGIDVDQMGWRRLVEEGKERGWRGLGMLNPLSRSGDDILNIAGRRAGRYLENNARIAQFIKKIADGLDPEDAARDVMKYLFDYGDVSKVSQKTLGRVFPFFRWTRFNLPLQVEALMTQPGKISSLVHAKNVVEADPENQDVEDALLAPFIRDSFNIQTRRSEEDGDKAEFFMLNNWIPAADLTSLLPERMGDELLRMVSPLIKTPAEQLFNYDTFRQREIERDPGELGQFLTLPMRKKTIHLLRNARILTEIDRVLNSSDFSDEPEKLGPGAAGLAENLFRTMTGIKLYGVDVDLSKRLQDNMRRQGVRGLRSLLVGAQRRGDTAEVERLIEGLRELRQ